MIKSDKIPHAMQIIAEQYARVYNTHTDVFDRIDACGNNTSGKPPVIPDLIRKINVAGVEDGIRTELTYVGKSTIRHFFMFRHRNVEVDGVLKTDGFILHTLEEWNTVTLFIEWGRGMIKWAEKFKENNHQLHHFLTDCLARAVTDFGSIIHVLYNCGLASIQNLSL